MHDVEFLAALVLDGDQHRKILDLLKHQVHELKRVIRHWCSSLLPLVELKPARHTPRTAVVEPRSTEDFNFPSVRVQHHVLMIRKNSVEPRLVKQSQRFHAVLTTIDKVSN